MQDIDQFAGNMNYWSGNVRQLDTLPKLSTAARVIVELPDVGERAAAKGILLQQAEVCGCRGDLTRVFQGLESELVHTHIAAAAPGAAQMPYLDRDGKGCVRRTIGNLRTILQTDPFFASLRYDELAEAPVIVTEKLGRITSAQRWVDADDAAALQHIEERYGIYDRKKYRDAFVQRLREVRFHPVKEAIEAETWDGEQRVDKFLCEWAGAADTPYTRGVSRLIFAGGIHRLYDPGCKFDYLPVLVGEQGSGKSTLVRWLALDDAWFGEITVFEGKEAVEQLMGLWICEVSELLALRRTRDIEAVKSFITRQSDHYRRPYAEHVEERPRQTLMIGTTNDRRFLRDKTGNRRFLPVDIDRDGAHLHYLEDACRAYIRQCWAEALALYREGLLSPTPDPSLRAEYRAAQDAAMEDDWRVGAIERYLEEKPVGSCVCVRELQREALRLPNDPARDPTAQESRELGQIMDRMEGWERHYVIPFQFYGKQRSWKKAATEQQKQQNS